MSWTYSVLHAIHQFWFNIHVTQVLDFVRGIVDVGVNFPDLRVSIDVVYYSFETLLYDDCKMVNMVGSFKVIGFIKHNKI